MRPKFAIALSNSIIIPSMIIILTSGAHASPSNCRAFLSSLDRLERNHFVIPHLIGSTPVSNIFADFPLNSVQLGVLRKLSIRDDITFEVTNRDPSKNRAYPASRYFRASLEDARDWKAAHFFLEEAAHVLTMGRAFPFQGSRNQYNEVMHGPSWMGQEYDQIYFNVKREIPSPEAEAFYY